MNQQVSCGGGPTKWCFTAGRVRQCPSAQGEPPEMDITSDGDHFFPPQEAIIPSTFVKQQLAPGKAGKLVPVSVEPTATPRCSGHSDNLDLSYGQCCPLEFHK